MKINPLLQDLNEFGEIIGTTNGIMYQLDCHLSDYKKILKERFSPQKVRMQQPIIETTLVFGDLTGNSDKGWKINFPSDYSFELRVEEIDEKINLLINREAMRNIAFTYEVLETFIFNIISKFLFLNKSQYQELISKKLKPKDQTVECYQEAIRNLRGKNNREVLSLLRTISSHFSLAEIKNHEGVNLRDWIEVLSQVRHGIIHSNFRIMKNKNFNLTPEQQEVMLKYFPYNEQDAYYDLTIENVQAVKIFNLITEYGFLVFKSLSIEQDYDWKVFRYMDGPPGHVTQH